MIQFEDFSFRYKGGEAFALQGISMTIESGSFVGIIGNSGAGKSTLTYALSGIVPHHFDGDFYGSVKVNGLDTVEVKPEKLAQFVGEVFQDIDSQMVSSIVEDEILFGMENFGVPHDEIGRRLDSVRDMLGIRDLKARQISSLSGGQKQKVAIAAILAMDPEIIVLDEPTGELDPASSIMIFDILRRLNREFGKMVIVVDRLLVMDAGKIVFDGRSEEIVQQVPLFKNLGINVPRVVELGQQLTAAGLYHGAIPLDLDQAEKMVKEVLADAGV